MRIVCFILGIVSIAACAAMVVLGINADPVSSESTVQNLRAARVSINDTRGDAYALAQIFGIVAVAWMAGAAAFPPGRRASAAPAPESEPPWSDYGQGQQQQQYPPSGGTQRQYPGTGPTPRQYPGPG